MLLYYALALIALLVLAGFWLSRKARKLAYDLVQHIKVMEEKYEKYIDKKLESQTADDNQVPLDTEVLTTEILTILEPDLDGLINIINKSYFSHLSIKLEVSYFQNLIPVCEEGLRLHRENKEKRLTEQDRELFVTCLQDAIFADLQYRLLIQKGKKTNDL